MLFYHSQSFMNLNRNNRQHHVKLKTVFFTAALLSVVTLAWVFLIFDRNLYCLNHHQSSHSVSSIFPWEPTDSENLVNRTSLPASWKSNGSYTRRDLKMRHILFGIAGSAQLWPFRKEYVKLWWRPAEMRGFVWLEELARDQENELLPPIKVSEDVGNFSYTNPAGHPSGIRIARIVQEAFRLNLPDIRWFVMGDDDTFFAPDNLLEVLRKYDHNDMFYIGNPSESHSSNTYFSHGMAFGGGGIAISYPLAKALSNVLDECLERYPFLFGSDDRLHACISELGVPLTKEAGFHQFDIHGDAFGLMAAHPIAPFVSMHHLDEVGRFFPGYSALDGLHRLANALRTEPGSFLQQCICYDRRNKVTFSISIGYVVQVYLYVLLPKDLGRPEITFKAWNKKDGRGEFDLDTRSAIKSRCNKPLLFYLDTINHQGSDVVSTYKLDPSTVRRRWRLLCSSIPPYLNPVQQIHISSKPMTEHWYKVPRRQCCKITYVKGYELGITVQHCQRGNGRVT
ncbi:hypothetical protein KP509_21G001800 [Ceratopteris richardii]|uniref:Uncharacterized protein n=1 Tax=Ceratopteris richardii TaxID=49495 RepID=A0A8T2S8S8_CERRI|nr:hypothetical protein KP509_21G001800 [Ceratopteris richardii]